MQQVIIGIDLGGSKIAIGAKIANQSELAAKIKIPTFIKGQPSSIEERDNFIKYLVDNINLFINEIKNNYIVLNKIGIGSPGKFQNNIIFPNTTPQFGPLFNDFDIPKALNKYFPNYQITIKNDAIAQMSASIDILLSSKQNILGQKIAYIGPGTGLGGGFGKINVKNNKVNMKFYTDGHIGDMIIDGHILAEKDYLSGMYLDNRLGIKNSGKYISSKLDQYMDLVKELGYRLGIIIGKIYEGHVYKSRKETMWNDEDRANVKGTKLFIIGGSIATKGEMGKIIISESYKYLNDKYQDVKFYLFPIEASDDFGIIGAASLI